MLLWLVLLFLIIALVMFFHKVAMKNSMEKKLGRKVQDRELTSITAWMDDGKVSKNSPEGSVENKSKE